MCYLRLAITGVSGKIGSQLNTIFKSQGIFADLPTKENLLGDLIDIKPTVIINCIGSGTDIRQKTNDLKIWNSNYYAASKILDYSCKNGIRFINLGSLLEKEVKFKSSYVYSKRAFTSSISKSFKSGNQTISILIPIIYGLNSEHILIDEILSSFKLKIPIKLESPEAIREFLHVKDLAAILIKIIHSDVLESARFEIGNGTGYKLSEVCKLTLGQYFNPSWIYTPNPVRTNSFRIVANMNLFPKLTTTNLQSDLIEWLSNKLKNGDNSR
jgi:nucleoside-diphosphate-sugar epimerase